MYTNNKFSLKILKEYFPLVFKTFLFLFLLITCSFLPPIYEKLYDNPELSGTFLVEVDEGFSISKTIIDSFRSTSYTLYKDNFENYEITWVDRVNENLCLQFIKLDKNLNVTIPKIIIDSGKSSYIDHKILIDNTGKINILYSAINNKNRKNFIYHITTNKDGKVISHPISIYQGIYIEYIDVCFDSKNNIYLVFSDINEGVTGLFGLKISPGKEILDTYKFPEMPWGKVKQPKLRFFDNRLYMIWRDTREDHRRPFIYLGVFDQDFKKIFEKKVGRTILYETNIQADFAVNENGIYISRSGLITEEDMSVELGGYNDIIMDIFDLNGRDIIRGKFITRTRKWSYNPHISFYRDKIHLIWMDNRSDRLDTYYSLIDKDCMIIKDQMRANDKGKDTYLPKVFSYKDDYAHFFWIGFNPDQSSKIVYKDNENVVRTNIFNKLGIGGKREYLFGIGGYLFSLTLSSIISILLNIVAVVLTIIFSLLIVNYLKTKQTKESYYSLLTFLIIILLSSLSRFYFKVPQKFLQVELTFIYTIIGFIFASIFAFLFNRLIDFKNQRLLEVIITVFTWFIFEGIFSIFPAILRIFV